MLLPRNPYPTALLCHTCKVIAALMVHLLLFCLDGRTIQIEQHLPLHLGEQLCKILHPGLIIDGETGYDVDMLDSWLFWGLLLLPLYFWTPTVPFARSAMNLSMVLATSKAAS